MPFFTFIPENRILKSGICVIVDILQSVLGLPSECTHNNVIRSCTLSFSCWIQGGHHAEGCGENKWLFSCCISDGETMDFNQYNGLIKPGSFFDMDLPARFNLMPKIKSQLMPSTPLSSSSTSSAAASMPPSSSSSSMFKKNMLRRRMDDNGMVKRKSSTFKAHAKFIAFNSSIKLQNQFECGVPRTAQNTIQKRIIGGRTAPFAALPWQAHIRIAEYQCGGILVSRQFVITAAHCIEQARMKDIVVYLGELDTQDSGKVHEPWPAEKHSINRKIIHPHFKFRIAQPGKQHMQHVRSEKKPVIRNCVFVVHFQIDTIWRCYNSQFRQLSRKFHIRLRHLKMTQCNFLLCVHFRNHILPICLPTTNIDLTGRTGIIAGWGKTSSDLSSGHTGTAILQTASVPIISMIAEIKSSNCANENELN